ncbi:ferrochelatase, mitochondrial-like protein [Chytridium lagenaria]|nr:ferrochelatase, mitochondrial-like protein [Chytridium lagenaria]
MAFRLPFFTRSSIASASKARFAHASPPAAPKTAVLLLNMGGPEKLSDYLAPWIAKRRTPKIQNQYSQIGGGSPIKYWTKRQGTLLEQMLDRQRPESAPHKSYVAFRYADPLSEAAIKEMIDDGVKDVVALSLYPQYSCSTTGSSLNQLFRKLKDQDPAGTLNFSVIDRWPTNQLLVEVFARHIEAKLKDIPEKERNDTVLLFSAHSLPMSVVNRGDTYPQEVAATVQAVVERLKLPNPYRLVWQSQVGPSAWLGPKTDDAIEGYAKLGKKNLLLVPIAFVSDHVETLFELDLEYGELAHKHKIGYHRAESLNDDPLFIEALADLVNRHLEGGRKPSPQLFNAARLVSTRLVSPQNLSLLHNLKNKSDGCHQRLWVCGHRKCRP